MSTVAAIGGEPEVAGFALAGVLVYPVDTPDQAVAAWRALPDDVAVVILTPGAGEAVAEDRAAADGPLAVVLPP